jgi:ABC-type Fe3+/spermidine/putrescine transport system ATPase subunit
LAPNPRLLLLDEPLSALDRNLRIETREELTRLQRQISTTFIVVTHDQEEALSLANRIGVMQHGRLAQVGTPAEVYERPVSRFVAEFLGAANILPARLRQNAPNGAVLELPGLASTIHAATPAPAADLLLALRPERLRLGDPERPDDTIENQVRGILAECSYAGETLIHTVRLDNGTLLRVSDSLRDGLHAGAKPIGAAVTVGWQKAACILLPS